MRIPTTRGSEQKVGKGRTGFNGNRALFGINRRKKCERKFVFFSLEGNDGFLSLGQGITLLPDYK